LIIPLPDMRDNGKTSIDKEKEFSIMLVELNMKEILREI
jgi:hypothetical protein